MVQIPEISELQQSPSIEPSHPLVLPRSSSLLAVCIIFLGEFTLGEAGRGLPQYRAGEKIIIIPTAIVIILH